MILSVQKRRSSRWTCSGEAEIVFSMDLPTVSARIADLSAEGCLLIAKQPVDLESGMQVELIFAVNQLPFRIRAQVRAVRSETACGFQFIQLSARSHRRLVELVEELEQDQRRKARGTKGLRQGIELS